MTEVAKYPFEMSPESEVLSGYHQTLLYKFRHVRSTQHLIAHPAYKTHWETIDKSLRTYEQFEPKKTFHPCPHDYVRIVAWNIERGMAYGGIIESLKTHFELKQGDIFLLTEVDHGMARSGNRHIAKDLAGELNCYGVFSPTFLNLDKGNGGEKKMTGSNTVALQGHTILSRFPISNIEIVYLPNSKDHLAGKERQIGQESVIQATIHTPLGPIQCANVHISAHSSREHRALQMSTLLETFSTRPGPALIGGDWNTTTFNLNGFKYASWDFLERAVKAYCRKVFKSPSPSRVSPFAQPDLFFERKLFSLLKSRGFQVNEFNVECGYTLQYNFSDPFVRMSLSDWVPRWCFKYIDKALKTNDGNFSLKVDWFAGRKLLAKNNLIVSDLPRRETRYSDHHPIITDIELIHDD